MRLSQAKWVIFPKNHLKQAWDIMIVILLLYTATYVPYKVCFEDGTSTLHLIWDTFIDMLFFIDIILTFFSATEDSQGHFETRIPKIAIKYIKSFFFIDLVTTFPFQLVESWAEQDDIKVLRVIRLQRLYRLLRIFRLLKLLRLLKVQKTEQFMKRFDISNQTRNLIKMLITVLFFTHLTACLWFFQAKLLDFPDDCWVTKRGLIDSSNAQQFLASYYWAFQTLTTVGYGDINANGSIYEMIIAFFWMIFGVGYQSYSIGNFIQIIQANEKDQEILLNKIHSLKIFQKQYKISSNLFYRIKRHIEHNLMQKNYKETEKFMNQLPLNLRNLVI